MSDRVIRALLAEGLSPAEVADALLLLSRVPAASPRPDPGIAPSPRPEESVDEAWTDTSEPRSPEGRPGDQPLHLPVPPGPGEAGATARPVRMPSAEPLRRELALARALRPFKGLRSAGRRRIVDIDATVTATADFDGELVLIDRPVSERRFDAVLVVDESSTIRGVWDETFRSLELMLAQVGAFRSVSCRRLTAGSDGLRLLDANGALHSAASLNDPSGRRLILLATNAVGPHWYTAAPWEVLASWAAHMPVSLLQLLPEHYWPSTALGTLLASVRATTVPSPQSRLLDLTAPSWYLDRLPAGTPFLPVTTLTADSLSAWATSLIDGTAWTHAVAAYPPPTEAAPAQVNSDLTAEQRVHAFLSRASRGAQDLAHLLSISPLLSASLAQIIQARLAPHTGVTELAELFVSGLLEESVHGLFAFRPGTATLLRSGTTITTEWHLYEAVSSYINARPHLTGTATALIPASTGPLTIPVEDRPFAALHTVLSTRFASPTEDPEGITTFTRAAATTDFAHARWPAAASGAAVICADPEGNDALGMAVLVDSRHLLTCRHVVGRARTLWARFPSAESAMRPLLGYVSSNEEHDLALLTLVESPSVRAARIRQPRPEEMVGKAWSVTALPSGIGGSVEAAGVIGAKLAHGSLRLDLADPSTVLSPGSSGAGVWSAEYDAVVAILTGRSSDLSSATAVSLFLAVQCFPDQLSGLVDAEESTTWPRRSPPIGRDGLLPGRSAALSRIFDWLEGPSEHQVLIVTGSPGSGKTELLRRIVDTDATSLPSVHDTAVRATSWRVGCVINARRKTVWEITKEIARAALLPAPDDSDELAARVREGLARMSRPFTIVLDSLDEAAQPHDLARSFRNLLPWGGENRGVRLIVATRRSTELGSLLDALAPDNEILDLDEPVYSGIDDLISFILSILRAARVGNPYVDTAIALPLAHRIASESGKNYLLASLIGSYHGLYDVVPATPEEVSASSLDLALRNLLTRTPPLDGHSAETVLTPLAFTEEDGWRIEEWRKAFAALFGQDIPSHTLASFANSPVASLLIDTNDDGACVLRHQALSDILRKWRASNHSPTEDQRRLFSALQQRLEITIMEDPGISDPSKSETISRDQRMVADLDDATSPLAGTAAHATVPRVESYNDDDQRPYFFLSYARSRFRPDDGTDGDRWVTKFYRDLSSDVGIISGAPNPGFMDRQIPTGMQWPENVAEALASCRVFIALLSPAYFSSEYCGKEWAAFVARARSQQTGLDRPLAIIPALWTRMGPREIPAGLSSMQYIPPDFPPQYASEGFYGIMKLGRYREQYKQAILQLARLVKETAEEAELATGPISSFELLGNAFAYSRPGTTVRRRVRLLIAAHRLGQLPAGRDSYYYGRTTSEWAPYRDAHQGTPLAAYAEQVIVDLGHEPVVDSVDAPWSESDELPTVLLIDPWISKDPTISEELRRIDEYPVNVLVPYNVNDREIIEAEGDLAQSIDSVLGRGLGLSGSAKSIPSLEAFRAALPKAVSEAIARYLKTVPVRPPEIPQPLIERPTLHGPPEP